MAAKHWRHKPTRAGKFPVVVVKRRSPRKRQASPIERIVGSVPRPSGKGRVYVGLTMAGPHAGPTLSISKASHRVIG